MLRRLPDMVLFLLTRTTVAMLSLDLTVVLLCYHHRHPPLFSRRIFTLGRSGQNRTQAGPGIGTPGMGPTEAKPVWCGQPPSAGSQTAGIEKCDTSISELGFDRAQAADVSLHHCCDGTRVNAVFDISICSSPPASMPSVAWK